VKGPRNPLLAFIFLFAFSALGFASASDVYITPDGSSQGVCTTNPQTPAWFNSGSNWGSGASQIGPGTKVHLCGTITAELTAQGNGSSGAPITIFFESSAKISVPACDNTNGCLNIDSKSYIVIDGGTACGPVTSCASNEEANGIGTPQTGTIESTLNGTSGGPCAAGPCSMGVSSRGISAVNATNIEIKNLIVRNMYVHSSSNDIPNLSSDSGILSFQGTNSVSYAIHDSTIHDGRELITYAPGNSDVGPQFYNVNLFHTAGAIKIAGSNSNSQLHSLIVHDSHIHDLFNWDAGDCVHAFHLDGIHMWGLSGGVNQNISFYNNLIDGNFGRCQTGTVFFEGENDNVQIYNNVVMTTYTQNNNGMVNVNGTNFQVYNNTIDGAESGGDLCFNVGRPSGSPAIKFQNNIVAGCNTLILTQNNPTIQVWDQNVYGQCSNTGCNSGTPFVVNGGAGFYSFAQWKAFCSNCDSHSQYGAAMTFAGLNADGSLQSSSPAVGLGANLYGLGMTVLDSDTSDGDIRTPTSRPTSQAWDGGAFNYGTKPNPPTALTATVK